VTFIQLNLPDGRVLDVRISGPENGLPLLFHHGTPGAGTDMRAFERAAHARDLRWVAMSRPGYGGSTRHAGRHIVDVVDDTTAVMEYLATGQCVVVGWSGGGPHALACAARLEGCLAGLILAGVAPYDSEGLDFMADMGQDNIDEFGKALGGEGTLRPYLEEMRTQLKDITPEGIITSISSVLPEVDKAVLTGELGEDLASSFHEALRPGVDGWLDDDLAFMHPWGFSLSEISIPTAVCQGGVDLMVPPSHGAWLAEHVPDTSVHLDAAEGHLSMVLGFFGQVLDELLAQVRQQNGAVTPFAR